MPDNRSSANPIVDVHCHLFNAADIPVRGFVRHVALHDMPLSAQLAAIAARLTGNAPGYEADTRRIDGLFGGVEASSSERIAQDFDADVADTTASLTDEERQLIAQELSGQAVGAERIEAGGAEAFSLSSVRRFVAWARLFSQSRVDLAQLYAKYFDPAPVLAIPMLVDLAGGVGDNPATSLGQQVELFDRLSEASMLGLLRGAEELRLHPFVSLDAFRLVDDQRDADGRAFGEVIRAAVLEHGFVGVKVYPEMGWRPSDNTAANAGTAERAARLDAALDDFFGWCADNSVPITAHCNHSNYPGKIPEDASYGAPEQWFPVMRRHEKLRVNLGHFGGAHAQASQYSWTWAIARGMTEFPDRLFGDVGCHPMAVPAFVDGHFDVLEQVVAAHPAVANQLMFGTDWYMEAVNDDAESFVRTYRDRYRTAFGDERADAFMGGNALRFLGFLSGTDANAARLRERYARKGATRPGWLAPGHSGGGAV